MAVTVTIAMAATFASAEFGHQLNSNFVVAAVLAVALGCLSVPPGAFFQRALT